MIDYNYTPEALSKKRGEAAVIYHRFTLLIPQYGEDAVYCFVEGYDMPYYRSIVRNVCRKEPVEIECNGKASVIAANKFIEEKDDSKKYVKRYFVDRDFDSNDTLPNSIFVTDGYAIENYYLSERCVSCILETEFKMSKVEHQDNHNKCMALFRQEHNKFFEGTLLLNAWYSSLYNDPNWKRSEVSLDISFPNEWINLKIGEIAHSYTLEDIENKFNKAPKIEEGIIMKRRDALRALGPFMSRGKFEIQFLFEFLSFIQNEPKKNRVYSVASCSLPFRQNTMISTFSQYADVTESLYRYIEKGVRIDCQM